MRIWDYLDAVLLRTIEVGFPITHLAAHASLPSNVFVAVRKPKADKLRRKVDPFAFTGRTNSIVYSVSLDTLAGPNGRSSKSKELLRIGKTRSVTGLSISPDGQWLVAIGNRKVQIARTASLRNGFTKLVSDANLMSLAFHPSEPTFATGDAVGKIRVWRCLDEDFLRQAQEETEGEKHAPSTVLHWHAHAVSALSFTPNGAYIVSGGEEAVLVLWQLSTGQREYVPRLGAPINAVTIADGISGREQEYALTLADGSVTFVGSLTLKVSRSFARIKVDSSRHLFPASRQATMPSPIAVEAVTGQLVLQSGHPSSLQFFDIEADRITSELEVAPSNRVSRPDEAPLEPTRVELVAFSSQPAHGSSGLAEWMATIDSRPGGGHMSNEIALKIWQWSSSAQGGRYILNTRIDKPHEEGGVSSLAFSPAAEAGDDGLLLVTTGKSDRKIKTWRLATHTARGGRQEMYWVPRSIAAYRNHAPSAARWSPDGSILAVAQGPFLTLWEPVSNSLIAALSCPEVKAAQQLEFVGRQGRYVAVGSGTTLIIWDLVRGEVHAHRSYDEAVRSIVPLENERLAVVRPTGKKGQQQSIVDVLDVAAPSRPAVTYQLPVAVREVTAGVIKQRSISSQNGTVGLPHFFAITSAFDVVQVGSSLDDTQQGGPSGSSSAGQSLRGISVKRRTLFDDLFGPMMDDYDAEAAATAQKQRQRPVLATKDIFALFDAPAHLLPPVKMLFDAFVPAVLPPRKEDDGEDDEGVKRAGTVEQDEDEEDEMDIDGDEAAKAAPGPHIAARSKDAEAEDIRVLTDLFASQLETPATSTSSAAKKGKPAAGAASSPAGAKSKPNGLPNGSSDAGKKPQGRKSPSTMVNGAAASPSSAGGKQVGGASPPASQSTAGAGKKRKSLS